eukprot:scaffold3126_cov136-Amphora_coffeaeformis.AAC.2
MDRRHDCRQRTGIGAVTLRGGGLSLLLYICIFFTRDTDSWYNETDPTLLQQKEERLVDDNDDNNDNNNDNNNSCSFSLLNKGNTYSTTTVETTSDACHKINTHTHTERV